MRALWITALLVACHEDEPLERLAAPPAVHINPAIAPPPPAPPPPPPPRAIPAPPPLAALVRDRFGIPAVTLRFNERTRELTDAEASRLVTRLAADDAFSDGINGCSCGGVEVRIARGSEHVDFSVDCGNVYLADRTHVGT
ncbi:MAG TPA: hypothetical protein VIV11_17100, partial [Kofleriaceae bacterium]